ncbi:hypothetical protein [Mycoplasmopsis columbinasalis]|nr:hypothetical protein [Mycoplasmopsis columbinasalis]
MAIYTLAYMFQIRKENLNDNVFSIIFALVFMMIISFVLNIALEIYKQNTRFVEYKKIKNTLYYLSLKYKSKLIDEAELERCIALLWQQLNKRKKIVLFKVLKEHFINKKVHNT